MNISYLWLKDYLNFDLTPQEVSAALTSIGLETGSIDEIQSIKGGLNGLVIGKVLTCIPHPNSDHLHITTVDLGTESPVQIVCGAANVAAGQHVVVATVGTTLYSGDESFTIKKSKIRGEESMGMICAEDEIGIGNSHEGIIELPESAIPGTPAAQYYKVESDFVLEVDITPNRVDAASHYGVARDLAAYLAQNAKPATLTRPSVEAFKIDNPNKAIVVSVENSEACPRYCGITMRNVKVQESPEWLRNRLTTIGLRPINNIVDISNFLLHETGQPLHCFDAAEIAGDQVIVKTVADNTPFVTLDEVQRKLSDKDLVICNTKEPMCIAGVFGGLKSGVSNKTTDIFIESAYFNPMWVRKTARRHALNTDSSFRFERGADPNALLYVLKRAALLIQELAGGEICGNIIDLYPTPIKPCEVVLTYAKTNALIGKEISPDTIKNILKSLEIEITAEDNQSLTLLIPTYRVDVQREVDVIEDILRIYGYNNIAFTDSIHSNLSYKTPTDESLKLQNLISEQLTGCGFNEILNNSLTKSSYYTPLTSLPEKQCVTLLNALSNDLNAMRQTLLFGGLETIAYNTNRRNGDLRLYEFGNCYFYNSEANQEKNILSPFKEEQHLGLWISGNSNAANWALTDEKSSVFQLKGYLENILLRLGIAANLKWEKTKDDLFAAVIEISLPNKKSIGKWGVVSPTLLKKMDIGNEVFFAELNWTLIIREALKTQITYREISKFPAVKRDLALLIDKEITFAEIEKIAIESEKRLLKKVSLFDVYEGKNLPEGKKSYAVSFILQDTEKTLNEKQIEVIMAKIQQNLEQKLSAKLR